MEREVACNLRTLGTKLGEYNNDLHVSVRDETSDIHDQRDGVIMSRIKTKRILGSDDSALKLVWIAVSNASKKWTMPISNWSKALSQFYVRYASCFPKVA